MKTVNQSDSFTESGINSRLDHKAFLTQAVKARSIKLKRFVRSVDKNNSAMFDLLGIEDNIAQSKVSIHPEFVAFIFHLYGLPRKLFLYIVFFEMDNSTCTFKITTEEMQRFREFSSPFKEEQACDAAIVQAARTLVRKNVMIELDSDSYMLNPLIAGGSNEYKRKKLIDKYSRLLEKMGFDVSLHFYPKYGV